MLEATQIAEIERKMKEEHKRDLEALQRLRKYLPASETANRSAQSGAEEPRSSNGRPRGRKTGLRKKIREAIDSMPDQHLTRAEIAEILDADGFEIQAVDPVSSMNQALRKLVIRKDIALAKPGLGSSPAKYTSTKSQDVEGNK
jgi:hypothetical protein